MWYNDLILVLMVFVVILLIVMAIVVSSWPRRAKSEVKLDTPEKIIVERGFEDEKVEPEYLSEQTDLQNENMISDLETLESSYPEDEEIHLDNIVQTESIKQKGVIRKISKPQVVKSEPKSEFEPKNKREETIEIETIEPIIIEESGLDAIVDVSIEDTPDSLLERETVEIESVDPIIVEDEEVKRTGIMQFEPDEGQEQEEVYC
jgi:FtsZ-interacting cell division protein ZipA